MGILGVPPLFRIGAEAAPPVGGATVEICGAPVAAGTALVYADNAYLNDNITFVEGADAIYTDVWASMGQEEEQKLREQAFAGYQVNAAVMAAANDDALFMHCLPAHRGEEVSAAVIDGPQSVVWDEAENRLHAQKALLEFLLT